MKILNRNTDYAIQALTAIAKSKEITSVSELCSELGIPRAFLRRILQILNAQGFLISIKGKGGGFKLGSSPEKISIFDVMQVFQNPVKSDNCKLKKEFCPKRKHCKLRKKLNAMEKNIIKELKSISIRELAAG